MGSAPSTASDLFHVSVSVLVGAIQEDALMIRVEAV